MQYRFGPKWRPFMAWSTMPGNSYLPGGGKGLGSMAPAPAVGDPGGTLLVKKKERARIRVEGQGDTIAIGGLARFQPGSATLAADQDDAFQRITGELRGKPQIVEIVATASRSPLPLGCHFLDRWELGYARCRATAAAVVCGERRAGTIPAIGCAGKRCGQRQRQERTGRRRGAREPQRHVAVGRTMSLPHFPRRGPAPSDCRLTPKLLIM